VPGGDFQLPNGFPYLRCSLKLEIFIYFFLKVFFVFQSGFVAAVAFAGVWLLWLLWLYIALPCFTYLTYLLPNQSINQSIYLSNLT
jgi:hypothetical protein